MTMEREPKAEEIIAEIYRQVLLCRASGASPRVVNLPYRYVRRLRVYRFLLGELEVGGYDYLDRYHIFNLDFCIHDDDSIVVA